MKQKTEVNYLYFGMIFLFLIGLTLSHFFRISQPFTGVHLFFLLYALGQSLLEVLCFMLLGYCLHRWVRWSFKAFIGISFAFLLAHFANFTLLRLMDVTISYFFQCFFGGGFSMDHFRITFLAMNMNSTMVAIIVGSLFLVPLAGIALYWATQKLTNKKPLAFSQKQLLASALCVGMLLLSVDLLSQPYLSGDHYRKYRKTLPLCSTFLPPQPRCFPLASTIAPMRSEERLQNLVAKSDLTCKEQPNIYLFVIETLRRDFINASIAPHMTAFGERHICPSATYANANSTQVSWFAIFHSTYPYHWTKVRDEWKQGSVPLQLLKKMGYKIRVYSSAHLSYFNMDQVIFGKDCYLIDSLTDRSEERLEPCYRDQQIMEALGEDVKKSPKGTLFLVFLDSTHSEYSSPIEFERPFQPMAASIDYLTISHSATDLELLKNRYRNSIHWVDHLMGNFFETLRQQDLYDDALITLTGDHGEEFFEDGALFHATHLNQWQTSVPLLYKFPATTPPCASLTTHLDIFPSILHYLTGKECWSDYCDGESLFAKKRWPYVLCVQHSGLDVPYEFSLSDGKIRLIGRFLNPPLIYSIPSIEVISLESADGRKIVPKDELIHERFEAAFTPLISPHAIADLCQTDG